MCCGWSAPDAATLYSPGRADSHKWVEDIAGTLSPVAAAECICLWAYIVGLRRNSEEEDAFRWTCSLSGVYSAKATYKRLQLGSIDFAAADAIWKNGAPIKCKIFMWLAILDRQWISARHQSWTPGSVGSPYFVCLQDHLFTQCVHARQVWLICFTDMEIAADPPSTTCKLED
jgi:hypothetical protein